MLKLIMIILFIVLLISAVIIRLLSKAPPGWYGKYDKEYRKWKRGESSKSELPD